MDSHPTEPGEPQTEPLGSDTETQPLPPEPETEQLAPEPETEQLDPKFEWEEPEPEAGQEAQPPSEPPRRRLLAGLRRIAAPVARGLDRAVAFAGTRLRAGGEAIRIRQQRSLLRKQRRGRLLELGEATYRQNAARVEPLRREIADIDARLERLERERSQMGLALGERRQEG